MIPEPGSLHFRCEAARLEKLDYPALMLGVFEGIKKPEGALARVAKYTDVCVQRLIDSGEIRGVFKEFTLLHPGPRSPFPRVLVMGLGDRRGYTVDRVRSIVARAARMFRKIGCPKMAVLPHDFPGDWEATVEAVVEGVVLGLYKFDKYYHERRPRRRRFDEVLFALKSGKEAKLAKKAIAKGEVLGWATALARDMANEPANYRTPQAMAEDAEKLARRHGLKIRVHDEVELAQMRMGGILAVGAASKNPPRLIELRYDGGGERGPLLGFVGKGVTFDSGGLSLKRSDGMYQMKYDMAGAAAVLGAMDAVATLALPINVIGLVPTAENVVDARGCRPGDVIRMYDGRHVEIVDTDAEGRLLLADALAYCVDQGADLMVDLATLTGGVITALGHAGSGVMGNNPWLVERVIEAGDACAERMWQLPLWPEFSVHLKSIVAEMANCHTGSAASSSTGGMFLLPFAGKTPWVHLDIAGTAWIDEDSTLYYHKPYLPKRGATGVGVRTLALLAERVVDLSKGSRPMLRALLGSA